MISKKKGMVLLFAVLMTTSMMLPLALSPKTEAAGLAPIPESSSLDVINNWVDRLNSDAMGGETVDYMLASYMETGELDSNVVRSPSGEVSVLVYYNPDVSSDAISEFATIDWVMNVNLLKVALVKVGTVAAMKGLSKLKGLRYMSADEYVNRDTDDYSRGYDDITTDMYEIRGLVGADYADDIYGRDGSGVTIGIVDYGVDFALPDMADAMSVDGAGKPDSFDPSGYSITTMTLANSSAVANTTAWLEMGYLLTYKNTTTNKYYLNTTGWDPIVTDTGYTWDYMLGYFFDAYMAGRAWSPIWNEFYQNELWRDWEIPAPTSTNYTAGWVFQRQITDDGYSRRFAPALVMNQTDLLIDFNTSMAITLAHNMQRYGKPASINFSLAENRTFITDMGDWSFVDDKDDGYIFTVDGKNVVVADTDNDLEVDWGLGGMCWAWDSLDLFADIINATEPGMYTEVPLFQGMEYDGRAFAIMFPQSDAHGTWVASAAASRGVFDHDVHGTGVTKTLPGVATGAKIIASDFFSDGQYVGAAFWSAGYHLASDGNWTFTAGQHQADISSNSWGFSSDVSELYYLNLVWDAVAAPNFIAAGSGSTLFVTSAGNDGGDYMSSGPFATSPSVVSVGASMATHYYDEDGAYGPNVLDSPQVIDFSSNGPQFLGMVKPDVVAPGFVGYNPNPSLQYALGGDSFAGWTGTSLACPIAAGVAAIIWEAVDASSLTVSPELVAQILLSSATDTGLDAFVQGNGLVNAGAALDAIGNGTGPNDVYFSNSDSFDLYSGLMTPAWNLGYHPLVNDSGWGGNPIYLDDLTAPPTGRGVTSLYFGQVAPLDVVALDVTAFDYGGTATADAGFTSSAWFYEFDAEYTFVVDTFKYNETGPLDDWALWDGVHNLTAEMGDAAWTNFLAADYATVSASFDAAAGIDRLRLFDWEDTDASGNFSHYNSTAPTNDYSKFIGQSMSGMNNMYVRLADPAKLDNLFDYSLGLYIRDADATLTSGNEVNITITLWKETTDTQIALTGPVDTVLDVQLTVGANAEPGIHQGYLELDRGTYTHVLPYSYNVEFDFNGTSGEEVTVIDGWGTDHEPFDNGVVMPNADPGWRVIPINIENSTDNGFNKTTLVVRVSWENPGTVVDFRLTTNEDSRMPVFETNGAMLPTQNTYIWDAGEDTTGEYYLMIQATSWDGNKAYENITVTLQAYDGITDATYDPTWTALDSATPAIFADAAELEGDHINITSVWDLPAVAGLPEYAITSSEISLLSGLYVVRTGTCANPGGLDTWPISIALTDNYVWETIDGINAGESVYVHLDVGHSDASFDAYMWDDANEDDVIDADELGGVLISVDDGGSDAAEEGTFVAPSTGTVAIRVFVWAWAFTPGDTYTLTVDTRVSLDVPNVVGDPLTTWYDTYDLDRNAMMGLVFTGYTDTNVVFSDEFDGVLFTNFFAPVLSNVAVAGDGAVKTITWDAADRNSLEVLTYEVLMSDDAGDTWQLLSAGTTTTGYTWDSTGFYIDDYTVQIRVADETGLTDELDSAEFDAGTLERPTPTEPPITTPPPPVDPTFVLWIGLIGGIGVGVVVILILFLVKKR